MKSKFDVLDVVIYLILGLFTLICAYPFYYIIINTISDNTLVAAGRILWVPHGIHFENIRQVLTLKGLPQAVFMSVARTVVGTIANVFTASLLGYAFTKKELWHRKFWYRFFIVTMYFSAGMIPGYLLTVNLGLPNTFLLYVVPCFMNAFGMILVKTYIESIPASLEESAEIDGAGYMTRYIRLIIPLTKPILATIAIFAAVGQWNSFMDTVIYMTDSRFYTMQYVLYRFLNSTESLSALLKQQHGITSTQIEAARRIITPVGVRFTMTLVTVFPILCLYPFFQHYFVKGIMIGAIKG